MRPRMNWRISMTTAPRLDVRSRASRLARVWPPARAAMSTSDILTSENGILAGAAMVGEVRSVLTRPQAPARDDKTPGTWLLLAGVTAFAVALPCHRVDTALHPH